MICNIFFKALILEIHDLKDLLLKGLRWQAVIAKHEIALDALAQVKSKLDESWCSKCRNCRVEQRLSALLILTDIGILYDVVND